MQFQSVKLIGASAWAVALCVAGRIADVHTLGTWSVVAAFAVVPPILLMWRWNVPDQTLSESIAAARR